MKKEKKIIAAVLKKKKIIAAVFFASLFLAFLAGRIVSPGRHRPPGQNHEHVEEEKDAGNEILYWSCSMHPEIQLPGPGPCPICGMDLIPVYADQDDPDLPVVRLSRERKMLAALETVPVEKRELAVELRLLGTIEIDETKMVDVTAWFPGRVEELYVNFLGDYIREGEPLLRIYSPELKVTQQEYLTALRMVRQARDLGRDKIESFASLLRTLENSKKRLQLLGMLPEQIRKLKERGKPEDTIDFYAPASGTIIERNAFEGKYFDTGQKLFHVADLSSVWMLADIYERDFSFVHPGKEVEFVAKAYPAEAFQGEVVFVDPVVDRKTRTARLRMEIKNPQEALKPGMFGTAVVRHNLGEKLSIPHTAALLTGRRALVYVEEEPLVYMGREVELGQRAGGYYPVVSGLKEGERVVNRANFKLDAVLQIRDRPSLMRFMPEREREDELLRPGPQEICPVMGGPIDKSLYVEGDTYRVYVCCPGCLPDLEENLEEYIRQMKEEGIELEHIDTHDREKDPHRYH